MPHATLCVIFQCVFFSFEISRLLVKTNFFAIIKRPEIFCLIITATIKKNKIHFLRRIYASDGGINLGRNIKCGIFSPNAISSASAFFVSLMIKLRQARWWHALSTECLGKGVQYLYKAWMKMLPAIHSHLSHKRAHNASLPAESRRKISFGYLSNILRRKDYRQVSLGFVYIKCRIGIRSSKGKNNMGEKVYLDTWNIILVV